MTPSARRSPASAARRRRAPGGRRSGSFSSVFLTFSLLLLVMAAGFVFGRLVIARAYVKTASTIRKAPVPLTPANQGGAPLTPTVTPEVQPGETPNGAVDQNAPPQDNGATPDTSGDNATEAGTGDGDAADTTSSEQPRGNGKKSDYQIQVGSFASEESARRTSSQLTRAGYPARIEADRSGSTTSYRVVTGHYDAHDKAQTALGELQRQGFAGAFVTTR
jgi:cell division septation protein DedD